MHLISKFIITCVYNDYNLTHRTVTTESSVGACLIRASVMLEDTISGRNNVPWYERFGQKHIIMYQSRNLFYSYQFGGL